VLSWVNLARKDKHVEPSAQVVQPEQIPVRQEGEAIVRVLVGEGSPVHLGTPALILDIELPEGGQITTPVPPGSQGFAYVLEGEGAFEANLRPARPPQLVKGSISPIRACGIFSMRSPISEGAPCCSRSCTSSSAVSSEPEVAVRMRRTSSSWCSGTR